MEESNIIFRGWNLTSYDNNKILNMIHELSDNNIYVGDYIIIDGIAYRFAHFYGNKCAALIPDRILAKSKNYFGITTTGKPYITRYLLPKILPDTVGKRFPIINARLMSENDINTMELFKYHKEYIKEFFNNEYLLSDICNKNTIKYVNENGEINTTRCNSYMGVRPVILIGYTVWRWGVK